MRRLLPLLLFTLACGDNHDRPDAHPAIDAAPPDAHILMPRAVAVAGDFGSPGVGTLSKLEINDLMMRQNISAGAALGDPVLRQYGDRLYVINRYGSNNITILDAKTLTLIDQLSTGTDSNPQDVAVVGTKLYVPALGTAGVLVLKPGMPTPTVIDLGTPLGDADGKPDCVSAYAVGTKLYVACDMQTNFVNVLDSKIAVIDTATDTYVTSVTTPYKNPLGFFAQAPQGAAYFGDLLIPLMPDYNDLTAGCLARVSTGETPTVACGPTNAELGGLANKIAIDDKTNTAYIAVAESFSSGKLRTFDLASGTLGATPLSTSSELIVDVAVCPGGDVVATDQTTNAGGLRVWRGTAERTTEAMSIGMPPTVNALVCYDP
jgi:DNA-binding beta-propeller fold protein YncE